MKLPVCLSGWKKRKLLRNFMVMGRLSDFLCYQCIPSVLTFSCTAFHCFSYLTLQINVFYLFQHVSPLDIWADECDSFVYQVHCIYRQVGSVLWECIFRNTVSSKWLLSGHGIRHLGLDLYNFELWRNLTLLTFVRFFVCGCHWKLIVLSEKLSWYGLELISFTVLFLFWSLSSQKSFPVRDLA